MTKSKVGFEKKIGLGIIGFILGRKDYCLIFTTLVYICKNNYLHDSKVCPVGDKNTRDRRRIHFYFRKFCNRK